MAGSLSMVDLVADLKASLQDSAAVFSAAGDSDFERHLNTAAQAFNRARPRMLAGSVTLVADQADYTAPADLHAVSTPLWGQQPKKLPAQWQSTWPGPLPRLKDIEIGGARKLYLDPPPTSNQIAVLGSEYRFFYRGRHSIHATDGAQTTIPTGDRDLLLLRAQAEAMREMALRNVKKPVALRDGLGLSGPRNGTPAALYAALMDEFDRRVH